MSVNNHSTLFRYFLAYLLLYIIFLLLMCFVKFLHESISYTKSRKRATCSHLAADKLGSVSGVLVLCHAQAGRGPSTDGTMAQLIAALLPTIDMSGSSSGIQAGRSLQQLGPCFMCGKRGHLHKSCPLLLGTANK